MASATVVHGSCTATVVQTLPAPPLRPFVSGYQFVEILGRPDERLTDFSYPSWTNIRFLFEGGLVRVKLRDREYDQVDPCVIYGPLSRAASVTRSLPSRGATIGVTPLGWATLFKLKASTFADRLTPVSAVIGEQARTVRAALAADPRAEAAFDVLDQLMMQRLNDAEPVSADIQQMHALLMSDRIISAADFALHLGVSPRHAARLSREVFGFAPKLLLRRRRFLRTLVALRDAEHEVWSRRLDPSYYDQSQFIRDFRDFMGCSPSEFFARPRPLMEASHRARTAILGGGVQGLQGPIRPEPAR